MGVRSKRLATGVTSSTAGAQTTVYTAPSGETGLVKLCRIYHSGGATGSVAVGITPAGGTRRVIHHQAGLANGDELVFQEFWVLNPGDALDLTSSVASGDSYYICGAELEGSAD